MVLDMKLKTTDRTAQVRKVVQQEKDKKYQPTWSELWDTGYQAPSGKHKNGIMQTKLSETDAAKLQDVRNAIESGELGTFCEELRQFSKSHAMNLHKLLMDSRRAATIQHMIDTKPDNYFLVQTVEQFNLMLDNIQKEQRLSGYIGLDTETTGLSFVHNRVCGFSISLPTLDLHYYVPLRHTTGDVQLDAREVFLSMRYWLESPTLGKVLHNAKFDAQMLLNEGITLQGVICDTMLSMFVLSENEMSYALKNIATKWGQHFGFTDKSATYESLFGKGGFEGTPLDIGTVYACKDTHLTVKLYQWILTHLEQQKGLMDTHLLETALIPVTIAMEQNGFQIDTAFAEEYSKELAAEVATLEAQLKQAFGDINMNSPDQMKKKLYTEMKLPDRHKGSVDGDTLEELRDDCEAVDILLKYRDLNKLLTTYLLPLQSKISPRDNRLHGQFKQNGAKTGRYSSAEPNLQNIPPKARAMFVAPAGRVLLGADFSKVEPTILAVMTGDEKFKQPFIDGIDIYSSLASGTFHKTVEQCGDGTKYRKMMKTGLLATMYGTSMFTLGKQLTITIEEAEQFISDFLTGYPVVAGWIESVHDAVNAVGYVETMFGRKRRFIGHKKIAEQFKAVEAKVVKILGRKPVNIWQEKKVPYKLRQQYWEHAGQYNRVLRQAVNAIIQGTGAEIMKKAMVALYALFQQWGSEYKILATIHDEIISEVPDTITQEQIHQIEAVMTGCVSLSLPLKVDVELMTRWGNGKKPQEWFTERGLQ